MKASEIIKNLQELIKKHGDLNCYANTPYEQTDTEIGLFGFEKRDEHYVNMFGQEHIIEKRFTSYL